MNASNDNYSHEEIAAAAQRIWEEEGQPEGKAEEHWERALEQLRQQPRSAEPATAAT